MSEEVRLRRELKRVFYELMVHLPDPVKDAESVVCEVWDDVLWELRQQNASYSPSEDGDPDGRPFILIYSKAWT